jgi:hypothetical protein
MIIIQQLHMKQILLVAAGHNFPKGPFAFLNGMHQEEAVHTQALFFRPVDYSALATASAGADLIPVMEMEDNEKEWIAAHKTRFARQCEQNHIQYTVHDNDREWSKDLLIKESRFADLMLISGEVYYAESDHNQPNHYLREALLAAECPVLIVPEDFTSIEHLFMAYDGSRESLYAIKQFSYLFPKLIDLPTEIVYIKDEPGGSIPDLEKLKQYTRLKFDCMGFAKLHFNAAEYFATWISEKQHALLITGSFGRSPFSYITKRSFAGKVIHNHKLPVFIAHHQ